MNAPKILPSALNPTGAPLRDPATLAKARQSAVEHIEWLERLVANEDIQRFFQIAWNRLKVTENKASDIDNLPPEKRDAWAQAHFELRTMVQWPERELASLKAQLKELDDKQRAL